MTRQDDQLEAARVRFTKAVAELHAALAELQAAALEAATWTRATDDRLTIKLSEAARILGVSRPTIYRMAKAGKLEIVKISDVACVRVTDLQRFVKERGLEVNWSRPAAPGRQH